MNGSKVMETCRQEGFGQIKVDFNCPKKKRKTLEIENKNKKKTLEEVGDNGLIAAFVDFPGLFSSDGIRLSLEWLRIFNVRFLDNQVQVFVESIHQKRQQFL
jgi:hypothetical protein